MTRLVTRIFPVNSVPFQSSMDYYSTIKILASSHVKNSTLITTTQNHSELVPATLGVTLKAGKNNQTLVRKTGKRCERQNITEV